MKSSDNDKPLQLMKSVKFGELLNNIDAADISCFFDRCQAVRDRSCHKVLEGNTFDLLDLLPGGSVQLIKTSIPYGSLINYTGSTLEFGSEPTYRDFLDRAQCFLRACFRVCKPGGVVVINAKYLSVGSGCGPVGKSSFAGRGQVANRRGVGRSKDFASGFKPKDIIDLPGDIGRLGMRVGFTWRANDIWEKVGCFPESVKDRPARVHENLILLSKGTKYKFYRERLLHLGSGMDRSVMRMPTSSVSYGHPATFNPMLAERFIYSASDVGDVVLDPFGGVGSTALAAMKHGRHSVTMELSGEFASTAYHRLACFAEEFRAVVEKGKPLNRK